MRFAKLKDANLPRLYVRTEKRAFEEVRLLVFSVSNMCMVPLIIPPQAPTLLSVFLSP